MPPLVPSRPKIEILHGDCLDVLAQFPDDTFDLVFTSPPYEDARHYSIDYNLSGEAWVDWAVARYEGCLRVCRGLVAWVVQGRTKVYRWSPVPAKLLVRLDDLGYCPRRPCIFYSNGIPGSGGPDWLRSDYQWILCFTRERGRLPWSNNIALGNPPKCPKGGDPTHRNKDGQRVRIGGQMRGAAKELQRTRKHRGRSGTLNPDGTITRDNGSVYVPPKKANPGDVIKCPGGHLGSDLAHENEAPFPEALAEFFIKSFCPAGGSVLDPFMGSGTTLAVAQKCGRHATGIDIRDSQVQLTKRRVQAG